MISRTIKLLTIIILLAGVQTIFGQYANRVVANEPENVTVLGFAQKVLKKY